MSRPKTNLGAEIHQLTAPFADIFMAQPDAKDRKWEMERKLKASDSKVLRAISILKCTVIRVMVRAPAS